MRTRNTAEERRDNQLSVGIEALYLAFLLHGVAAFFVGSLWSLIPRKSIGLMAFALFYLVIAIGYIAEFGFQMLMNTTFYVLYVIVGLVGFAFGAFWSGKRGYYKKSYNKNQISNHE
jgi:hypothetical protein